MNSSSMASMVILFIILIFVIVVLIANIVFLSRLLTLFNTNVVGNPPSPLTPFSQAEVNGLLWFNAIILFVVILVFIYLIYLMFTATEVKVTADKVDGVIVEEVVHIA
jgi:hypothetical protein